MRISDAAVKKPVFAWMLMAGLIAFGSLGVRELGVSQMPDVDFPQVTVDLTLEGASPETMETDVVDPVEDACMNVEGIRDISSTSRTGQASVTVEFDLGRDIDAALQDVQTKVAQAQRRLPDAMDPPVITKSNPEDQPIMWVAVRGPRSPLEISDIARFTVKDQLQTVPGVGEIRLGGFRERNLRVWLDVEKLEAHDLTAGDVLDAIRREHVEIPAGRLESDAREVNVRLRGEAMDTKQFREIVVAERGGARIRIEDLGLVEDGLEDRRRIARSNGVPATGLGIKKQRGANAVAVAKGVRERLVEVRKLLPEDLELAVTFDSTAPVEEAIHEIGLTLILAVLLTGLVCWMFLGSISATINVLLSIPTSIIGTFAAMYFLGFTLNTFTLLGLSLAVGIVVDDAIMVLENIHRRAEHGEGRIRAAIAGAREISFAAMATTAAIVAIFLPVAFMKGIVGKFFFEFGVTISVAVLLSLLEALTLTPSRCAQMLSVGERRTAIGRGIDRAFDGLAALYERSLHGVLRWRWAAFLGGAAVFVASLQLLPGIKREMTPSQDIGRALARIQTPVGSSIDATDEAARKIEEILLPRPDVETVFVSIGGMSGGAVNTGVVFLTLVPRSQRELSVKEFVAEVRGPLSKIPDLRVSFQDLSQQGFTASRGFPVEMTIRGADWKVLAEKAETLMEEMRASDLYRDVDWDYLVGMPEIQVFPDRELAASSGVSMEDLAETVRALVGGVRVGTYEDRGRRYDVRVRLLSPQRTGGLDLGRLKVRADNGELVPLKALVRQEPTRSMLQITRKGRERSITLFANVGPEGSQAEAVQRLQERAQEILPPGYHAVLSGSAQALTESFEELKFAILFGIAIAYMILASQFNSLTHPLTVLIALPFSLSGALAALYLFDQTLNVYSFIGIVLLMGIVKKNSILLVDFTNQRRLLGASRDEALLHACPLRLRPILMTSFCTVAGALPAAVAAGPGAEVRQPMALAVVGGVVVSTAMTLLVVPALYSLLDGLSARFSRAGKIEREATAVLADLQVEEAEAFRHGAPRSPEAVGAGEPASRT
jgi:hydrophobe/amphiphile efflux-1 (HAE1) family protein